MMNYIVQLNTFENLCIGILPPKAQLIYYKLFKWSNRFGLGNPFRLSNSVLMLETGITNVKTFTNNRNLLKQYGFIDFKGATNKLATEYVLYDLTLWGNNMLPQTTPQIIPQTTPQNAPQNAPQTTPPYIHSNNNIQSNKNKTKQKNMSDSDTGFDIFWEHYPRHEGKAKARESFLKVIKKGVALNVLIDAIEKHKQSQQWQKDGGQYIPHPATWLNQQRWEDEMLPGVAPKSQPIRRNDAQAGYERAKQLLGITEDDE